ncbi:MAG: hypothetical protein SFZ03_10630 [Candidatus Melainabacteria bacterium]|nr:hypothetical protein [Candidatus Melainabacteria bacterium]
MRAKKRSTQTCFNFDCMTRQQALIRVKRLLHRSAASVRARQLIGLFDLQAEELTELGLDYELVKSLCRF